MKSVVDRMWELFDDQPRIEYTAHQLKDALHCSYSTARTALKKAFDAGKLKRAKTAAGELYYWKAAH